MAPVWIFLQCIILVVGQGLDYEPKLEGSDLIWFNTSNPDTYSKYTDRLDAFLKPYKEQDNSVGRFVDCSTKVYPVRGQACRIQVGHWQLCTASKGYGYGLAAPCVILKFPRIDTWTPEYYNGSTVPASLPEHLKYRILSDPPQDVIWLSCEGEYPADIEYIGPLLYHPIVGFPGSFFSVEKKDDFVSPLVGLTFEKPTRGVAINVKCTAYAPNLDASLATTRFAILVD